MSLFVEHVSGGCPPAYLDCVVEVLHSIYVVCVVQGQLVCSPVIIYNPVMMVIGACCLGLLYATWILRCHVMSSNPHFLIIQTAPHHRTATCAMNLKSLPKRKPVCVAACERRRRSGHATCEHFHQGRQQRILQHTVHCHRHICSANRIGAFRAV